MTVPGLLVSAPSSASGKTTVTLGLLRALRDEGTVVQPFKCGPDYIDPAFHGAAGGRASYNLDSWAMHEGLFDVIAAQSAGTDLAVAEGAMGLFDGAAGQGAWGTGASADVSHRTGWPVVLVLDASGQAQSIAATALGFMQLDRRVAVTGVILNKVASHRHERLLRSGLDAAGIRVFGALPRRDDLGLAHRHLGLVQASERPELEHCLRSYAEMVRTHLDLGAIRAVARGGSGPVGASAVDQWIRPPAQRIAIAQDIAFSFAYPHMIEAWRKAGAQVLPFSPLANEAPATDADLIWLPGGYPELHAGTIADADRFLSGLRRHAETRPVHGECGGYMVLGEALIDREGNSHAMAGLLGLVTSHAQRRLSLGYRQARLCAPVGAYPAGTRLRGHEFRYSTIVQQTDPPLAHVTDAEGNPIGEGGSWRGNVSGTFFHMIAGER